MVPTLLLLAALSADPAAGPDRAAVTATVDRALGYLDKSGTAWMQKRQCVSCHQISSMMWAFNAAAAAGLRDDPRRSEWMNWSLDWAHWMQPDQKKDEPAAAKANVDTFSQLVLGRYGVTTDEPGWVERLRDHTIRYREPDGFWKAQGQLPLTKRPLRESNEVTTMWALLSLKSAGTPPEVFGPIYDRATAWLTTKPATGTSAEWLAARLLMAQAFDPAAVDARRSELISHQHDDGGWGWKLTDAGDALGTGLALYALAHTAPPADEPAVRRAVEFLRRTQSETGSWPVPSTRTKDKNDVRPTSTAWGAAWAAIGLIESLGR